MTKENRTYITHLKITDVPWHRLTTAYGRGTDFPAHLAVLEQMRDLASVKESLYELTTNMEHQSTLWHATPFGMVFLSRLLEKALAESGQNPVTHFLAVELLDFFVSAVILGVQFLILGSRLNFDQWCYLGFATIAATISFGCNRRFGNRIHWENSHAQPGNH